MRYSPEALTAFVEAVDSGSFSAAARRLRKSQSTISTAIANLEADLGVILFDRATRQPTLTPQGEQVLSYVKAILAASERLDELAVSLSGETEPRLTFVLSDTLHPDVLEDLLVQFDRRFPHTEFECLIGEDEDVIDLLQKSRAQVGLIEARERYPTDIGSTRLPLQTAMGIYVAPGHPLAAQATLTPADFQGENYISLSRTDSYRQLLDALFLEHQVKRRMMVETHSAASICAMVRAGAGISVVNPLTALDYADSGVVVRRFSVEVPFTVSLIRPLHRPRSALVDAFVAHLQQSLPQILTPLASVLQRA